MIRFVLFTLGLCFLSSAVTAQTIPKSKYDTNNNGEISEAEYLHHRTEDFNKTDKNYDNKLSKDEMKAAAVARREDELKERFLRLDSDQDGEVTHEEYVEGGVENYKPVAQDAVDRNLRLFEKMDVDKNNHVSRAEFDDWARLDTEKMLENKKTQLEKRFKQRDKNGDGVIREEEYLNKDITPLSIQQLVDSTQNKKRIRLDGNGDGDVTRSEYRAFNVDYFKRMDKNSDGVIKKSEARYLFQSN